jgi:hypothetical protein
MEEQEFYDSGAIPVSNAGPFTVFKVIWGTIKNFFIERPGQILLSGIILLMLWGYHGELDLLKGIIPAWSFPGENIGTRAPILSWVPWDRELISFWGGALLVVLIPVLIIRFGFKEPLSKYGLGFPPKDKRRLAWMIFFTLLLPLLFGFYFAAKDPGMQQVYPFYRPFGSWPQFLVYELSYFPFFLAIEFIFRGYFLFGLANNGFTYKDKSGNAQVFYFGRYAILIGMLSYTAWHFGKPLSELWGTPVWGLAAGACAYAVRSIWPVLMVHWLLNVYLDALILHNLGLGPF